MSVTPKDDIRAELRIGRCTIPVMLNRAVPPGKIVVLDAVGKIVVLDANRGGRA